MTVINRKTGTVAAFALVIGLSGILPACAKEAAPLYTSASAGGVERQSTVEIERSGDRAARNATLVKAMAQIDAYQQIAGKLSQTMGSNFSVKHLGVRLQDDHDKIDSMLQTAMSEAAVPDTAATLPADMAQRIDALYHVPIKDFDRAFLAAEVQTDQQALVAIGAYGPHDLDTAGAETLAMLTQQLENRMAQARNLQRSLG
jgi:predicted outer membrane protein